MKNAHTACCFLFWISSLLLVVYLISKDPEKKSCYATNSFLVVIFFIQAYILWRYEEKEKERERE